VQFLAFLRIGRIVADAPPKCVLGFHDVDVVGDGDGMETRRRNMR
jgi:hypothetical protein